MIPCGSKSCLAVAFALASCTLWAATREPPAQDKGPEAEPPKAEGHKFEPFKPEAVASNGSVTVGGHAISYQAIAGTLIVHPKGWDDVPRDPNEKPAPGAPEGGEPPNPTAEAAMFYV